MSLDMGYISRDLLSLNMYRGICRRGKLSLKKKKFVRLSKQVEHRSHLDAHPPMRNLCEALVQKGVTRYKLHV